MCFYLQISFPGTCVVKNPETNEEFPVTVKKSDGTNGQNGECGLSGKIGIDGNDMALIDKSVMDPAKFYMGDANHKLEVKYANEATMTTRLNGYKRYVCGETACFINFYQAETIEKSERRQESTKRVTTRKANNCAVAKKNIILEKVISEAETLFGKQKAFLADACKESAKSVAKAEEEEEEESSENVAEEIVVIRQKEEPNKLPRYTRESDKQVIVIK
jgi:hypothetical protein